VNYREVQEEIAVGLLTGADLEEPNGPADRHLPGVRG
jgi:hypothetical protein